MKGEALEQSILINWCNLQKCKYPELDLIFHIPNGGTRNKREAANLKKQGVKAGVPDLMLPVARKKHHGLFIEMKFGKNKTTDNQDSWIEALKGQGYLCKVCNGAGEAIETIKSYLG